LGNNLFCLFFYLLVLFLKFFKLSCTIIEAFSTYWGPPALYSRGYITNPSKSFIIFIFIFVLIIFVDVIRILWWILFCNNFQIFLDNFLFFSCLFSISIRNLLLFLFCILWILLWRFFLLLLLLLFSLFFYILSLLFILLSFYFFFFLLLL
jgi:hypothetical protein